MKQLSLLLVMIALVCISFAAIDDFYSFNATTGTYTAITGTAVTDILSDDAISAAIPIGFSFAYGDVSFTEIKLSSNGWIGLGTTQTGSNLTNSLASTTIRPVIAPLWDDLSMSSGSVQYLLSGTAPSRILTIQYTNAKWNYGATNQFNFQVRLYESGKIDIVYGSATGTPASASASIGINMAPGGSGWYYSVSPGNPATASMTTENTAISTFPAQGTIYEFNPTIAAENDLAALSVSGSTTPSLGTLYNYTATIRNRGSNSQSNYQVKLMQTGNVELASINGTTILPNQVLTLSLPWTPTVQGPTTLYAKVVLAGDQDGTNDQSAGLNITVMPQGMNVITIGDGSQTARMPIDMYFRNSVNQTMYYPTEMGIVGNITAVTLYNQFVTTTLQNKPTKIWMGISTLDDLSAGWIPASELTLVYDGTVTYPAGTNDILIPLQNIFPYTGGNLVVMFNRPFDTGYFSSSDYFKCQTVGTNRARNIFSDSVEYDPNSLTGGTLTGQFAKTTFYLTPMGIDPIFLVNPATKNFGTVLINTTNNQTFTIINGGGGTLTVDSISIAGSPHFTLQNLPTLPVSLTTGQTATFTGRYLPTAEGNHTATITITDNTTRLPHTVALSGNCIDTSITTLPYTQNFDALTTPAIPIDWNKIQQSTSTTAYVQTYTTTPYSTPNVAGLANSGDAAAVLHLIAPPLSASIPANTTRVKFYGRAASAGYPISVGVMSSHTDATSYQEIQSIPLTTTWTEYSVTLAGYQGTGSMISFKHALGGAYRTLYIDNVTIELIAQNDLAALSVSGNVTPSVNIASTYTVNVMNNGTNVQNNYQVKLFREGDVELSSVAGASINPGQVLPVALPWTPSAEGNTYLYGKVVLTADQNTTNDQTPNLSIAIQPAGLVLLTVGAGDQTARIPIDMYYKNSLHQYILYPGELGNTIGSISAIALYNQFTQDLPNMPTKVWISTTTQTDLSAGWIPTTNQTLVFDGNITYPTGENTLIIPFIQSYLYLNGENLLLTFNRPMDTQYYNSTNYFKAQTGTELRARNIYSDAVEYDPAAPPATGGTNTGQFAKTTLFIVPGGVGHLNGTVSGVGGLPLQNVTVTFATGGYSATTDFLGQFSISNILPGSYQVTYSRYGYIDQTNTVVISEDQTNTVNINLVQMATVSVSGTIHASDTGAGINGAGISLSGYENYTSTTNAQGQINITGVYANQSYTYTIVAPGYQNATGTLQVGSTNHNMGNIVLNEVAYAPRQVMAEVNNFNTEVNLAWLAPDPTALDLSQGFEPNIFPPADWSNFITNTGPANTSGVFPTWCRVGAITISGEPVTPTEGSWQAGLWWDYNHQDEWLITPQFNCPPAAQLRFDSHVFLGSTNGDHYYVKISVDGGTEWTVLWDASAQTGGWNNYASPITLDLSTYEGLQVKLAWHAIDPPSNDGIWYVWFIDNVYIGNETTTVTFDFDQMAVRSTKNETRASISPSNPISTSLSGSRAMQQGRVRNESRMEPRQDRSIRTSSRALTGYKVWRLVGGQETNETSWILVTPNPVTATDLVDPGWATLPNGTYRWAVKAIYTSDVLSVPSFSNSLVKHQINGTIAGVVRTSMNQPIAGASVTAGGYSATTNAGGAYNILLPIGTYNVTCTATGYGTQTTENVVVNANQTSTVNFVMTTVSNEDNINPVLATELGANYPNPFNPSTTITYNVKEAASVRLEIYNVKGQLIRTLVQEEKANGRYSAVWNGRDNAGRSVSSGIYFYRMSTDSYSKTRKMLLME